VREGRVIGRTLSTYRVVERLGAGGMGEVYLARDERLGRDVALKVLPAGRLEDETARSRFRKEAQALLRLNHPHVATLFDFGCADGVDYLVMERVPGRSLDVVLREGPLAEKEVLRLGAQLARGLAAAHEAGIVHRDLKPSNLALTSDGLLKILDFGLARVPRTDAADESTTVETAPGAFVGTPAYMAPEQLRGEPADARTDVYATGAVLYELATGRKVFARRTAAEAAHAVLGETPEPPRRSTPSLSVGFEAVVLKALDKDKALRYQSARELLVDIERLQQGNLTSVVPVRSRGGRAWVWGLAAAGAVLVASAAGLVVLRPSPRITGVRVLAADLMTSNVFGANDGSWATDGQNVYYVAGTGDDTDSVGAFRVPIAGGDPVRVRLPVPSFLLLTIHAYVASERALLVSGRADRGVDMPDGLPLWLVPVPFGTPRRIPNLLAWGAELGPDGRTLALTQLARRAPLGWRLVLAGLDGSSQRVVGELPPGIGRVRWTGDGRRLRFSAHGLGAVSWEAEMWEMPLEGGQYRPLGPGIGGRWTNDGKYFLFERQGGGKDRYDIFVRDESHWLPRIGGATQRLTVGPLSFRHAGPAFDGRHLFAYGHMGRGQLMRLDPATNAWTPLLGGESAFYAEPSRDGQWLAWVRYPDGTLWKSRPDGSERLQLTSPPLEAHLPRWSPDGTRLAFAGRSPERPQMSVHVIAADGSSMDEVARPQGRDEYWDPCWMPDGKLTACLTNRPGLIEVDARGGAARPIPGTDRLSWNKCSRQGDLLATEGGDPAGDRLKVRRAGAATWEDYGPAGIVYPNWTRDGRAFCGYQILPEPRVVCRSLASRQLTSIAENPPFPLLSWQGSAWMGLDAEDRPIVTADRSTLGFYVLDWEAP
jgi:hypothetical protein